MAGGSSKPTDGKKKARIEIIPLIDVIFFLLATFVLFTLSLNKITALDINLPVAPPSDVPPPDEKDNVTIQVSEGSTIYWNRELINRDEVTPRLQNFVNSTPTPRVLVSSDERAKYGDTINILDEVRKVGIKQVSVETIYRPTGK